MSLPTGSLATFRREIGVFGTRIKGLSQSKAAGGDRRELGSGWLRAILRSVSP
jgi:hypothetical protein